MKIKLYFEITNFLSLSSERSWLGVIFGALHCNVHRIGVEVFGELRNVVLEENGEDKIVRESN